MSDKEVGWVKSMGIKAMQAHWGLLYVCLRPDGDPYGYEEGPTYGIRMG